MRLSAYLLVGLLLAACARAPVFDLQGVKRTMHQAWAVTGDFSKKRGVKVLWGGIIINTDHMKDRTQLEVLGFPLDGAHRPDTDAEPLGRFLVDQEGHLETADFAQGRVVTVMGRLTDRLRGRVGPTEILYPVVTAEQLHLWPESARWLRPDVHLGIGTVIGR